MMLRLVVGCNLMIEESKVEFPNGKDNVKVYQARLIAPWKPRPDSPG